MIFLPSMNEIMEACTRKREEKPRIARYAKQWFCGVSLKAGAIHVSSQSPIGFGDSPRAAYQNWKDKQ